MKAKKLRLKDDPTIQGLQEELDYNRDDTKTFGRSDYRRGYRAALLRAVDIRKRELAIEKETSK